MVLNQRMRSAEFVEQLMARSFSEFTLSRRDRSLCQELVYGVVRREATLDWLIHRQTSHRPQNVLVQNLLRLGLYQLFYLERIPHHALVHETVSLAKRVGVATQAGFINAVLRHYARKQAATRRELDQLKQDQPALGYSHPAWLCERWEQRWGPANFRRLLEWNNTIPPTYARLNTLRGTGGQLQECWQQEGVEFLPRRFDWVTEPLVFELISHPPIAALPSFRAGWFYVQDPSTLLAVYELDPQPGECILDLCAAPGGKTTFIAQKMNNRGTLHSQDLQTERLDQIRENCDRLGITCVTVARPPEDLMPELTHLFDRVLLDAPCSNSGVLRRRVEARWRIRPGDLAKVRRRQRELIRRASAQLKRGGRLVYSTCSLEDQENFQVVNEFLQEDSRFELLRDRQLLPFVEGVDGAYVATLRRRE